MYIENTTKGYRAWHTIDGGKVYTEGKTRMKAINEMLAIIFK